MVKRMSRYVFFALLVINQPAFADINLLAEGFIAAKSKDQSGLTGILEDGATPQNQVGGLGGAIAYSGEGQLFFAAPDRGPGAGETSYKERIYKLDLGLKKNKFGYEMHPHIINTQILKGMDSKSLTGDSADFDSVNSASGHRRDNEAIRVAPDGKHVYISDEYGPFIEEFDAKTGKLTRELPVPGKYKVDYPSKYIKEELNSNIIGRQSNRGFEGLAITPSGDYLLAIVQDPLLQDLDGKEEGKGVGLCNRMLLVNTKTGAIKEFVYELDHQKNGVSEILAMNDHEFLVLERDSKSGDEAKSKKIYKIDLSGAADVHAVKSLSATQREELASQGITSDRYVHKTLFMDLMAYGIKKMPEKLEGMTFGPLLPDKKVLFLIGSDNDFSQTEDSRFFAFAIDPDDIPTYVPQKIHVSHQ